MKMTSLLNDPGSPVAHYAEFVRFTGKINSALLLSQLIYWMGKGYDRAGWIRKCSKELEEETGLKKDQQENARKILKNMGILEEKRKGIPPTVHFRIKEETLKQLWAEHRIKRGDSPQLKRQQNALHKKIETAEQTTVYPAYISESTHKNTQKSTSEMVSPLPSPSDYEAREQELKLKDGRSQNSRFEPIGNILNKPRSV